MITRLSPLEEAVVTAVAKQHWPEFRVDCLRVKSRENTGVGCYVHFEDDCNQVLTDGSYGAEGLIVEMQGLEGPLYFAVEVSDSRIHYLELVTDGGDSWDGVVRPWKII